MATVCGVIQRVNKLISVVPVKARYLLHSFRLLSVTTQSGFCVLLKAPASLRSSCASHNLTLTYRYNPELGDVVVGRVTEVS